VQVFTKVGVHVRIIGNGEGSGDGQFNSPYHLAVDDEHLFVADYR
jgi:hypothetical protein